jgi:hypothetical protein
MTNKTRWDNKKLKFVWTVEWIIVDEAGNTRTEISEVDANQALHAACAKYIHYEKESIDAYLQKVGCPADRPTAIRLDASQTLGSELSGKTVIEYPTIFVTKKGNTLPGYEVADDDSDTEVSRGSSNDSSDDSESESDSDGSYSIERNSNSEPEEESAKGRVPVISGVDSATGNPVSHQDVETLQP